MATLNPVGPGGVIEPSTRSQRVSSLNRVVIVSANLSVKAAKDTKKAFQKKPFHATALTLAIFSLGLHVIATWTPFYSFKFNSDSEGDITLTDLIYCVELENTLPWINSDSCIFVHLKNIAGLLSYFYTAGAVALSFLIVGIIPSIAAVIVTNARRKDAVDHMPDSLFNGKLSLRFLRTLNGCLLLHGITALTQLVSFASYAGIVNNGDTLNGGIKYNLGVVFDPDPLSLNTTNDQPTPVRLPSDASFTGGFIINIIAFFFTLISATILYVKRGEVANRLPGAEASGVNALQEGFASVTPVQSTFIGNAYGNDDDSGLPPAYPNTQQAFTNPPSFNLVDNNDMNDVKL